MVMKYPKLLIMSSILGPNMLQFFCFCGKGKVVPVVN
jgi:hypothetical protein